MLRAFSLEHPSPLFSTKGEAGRGQEAAPPHICTLAQQFPSSVRADLSLLLLGHFWYLKVGLCTEQTPARLDSAGARTGAATRAHAAAAQLPLVLHLFAFLPDKTYAHGHSQRSSQGGGLFVKPKPLN